MSADQFLYNTEHHPKGAHPFPTFAIRDGRVFTTVHHSDGADPNPWYVVKADNKLYPTPHHPQRAAETVPWYAIKGQTLHPVEGHPHGVQTIPWFELRSNPAPLNLQ